jgi:hypothetical protein
MTRLILLLTLLVGCGQTAILDIAHYEEPCLCGEERTTCVHARGGDFVDYETLCFGIDGYEHAWGVGAVLEVEERKVLAPPQDGSSVERVLVAVISETPVEPGTLFTLRFHGALDDMGYAELLTYDGAGGGAIVGGPAFTCEPASVCDDMQALDDVEQVDFEVDFAYGDPIDGPLIATTAVAAE